MKFNFSSILRSNMPVQKQKDLFNFGSIKTHQLRYGADSAGALHWSSDEADKHAKQYYEFCRKRKTDCDVIAKNTGLRIEDNDITMLNHEFFESVIEKAEDLTYREAHDRTDIIYHYISEHEKEATGYDGMVHRINRK